MSEHKLGYLLKITCEQGLNINKLNVLNMFAMKSAELSKALFMQAVRKELPLIHNIKTRLLFFAKVITNFNAYINN